MVKLILLWTVILFLFTGGVSGDSGVVKIAGTDGGKYWGPEVKIAANGDVYIVYEKDNGICLSCFKGGEVEFIQKLSQSSVHSYDPALGIEDDGTIHVVWVERSGTNFLIKYRYLNGTSWSDIINLGKVSDSKMDRTEDMRLVVDGAGNLAVVFTTFLTNKTPGGYLLTKHGTDISMERLPLGGLAKHVDVAIDSHHIHLLWQYKGHGEYTIMYTTKENRYGGQWGTAIDLKHGEETQRPRLIIDKENCPHAFYFEEYWDYVNDPGRILYYQYKDGNSFTGKKRLSDLGKHQPYHYLGVSVNNSLNMVVSMQAGGHLGGGGIFYNWMINGEWQGYKAASLNGGARPGEQSVALSATENMIYIAYSDRDEGIYLYYNGSGGGQVDPAEPNKTPIPDFSFSPDSGIAPLDVNFDASGSTDSDGSIVDYHWDFGDGSTGSGRITQHKYLSRGVFNITLTVKDDKGAQASKSSTIDVTGISMPEKLSYKLLMNRNLFVKQYLYKVTWDKGQVNLSNGVDIKEYKIFRKRVEARNYLYLTTVEAKGKNFWYDRSLGNSRIEYHYGIQAVDQQGRVSDMLIKE